MQHFHRPSYLLVRVGLDEVVQLLLEAAHNVGEVLACCWVCRVQVGDGLLQVFELNLCLFFEVVAFKERNKESLTG